MNEKRNVIEMIKHNSVTKMELIELINKNFPDDEVGNYGSIAQIETVRMTNGTVMQSVLFGKIMQ